MKKHFFLIIVIFGLMSCGNSGWEQAQEVGTIKAYKVFIEENPEHKNISLAKEILDSLIIIKDNELYALALKENTIESFKKYIENNPEGINNFIARIKLDDLREKIMLDSLWQIAIKENTSEAYQKYIDKAPDNGDRCREAKGKLTEFFQEKFKTEFKTIANFYSKDDTDSYTDFLSEKQCHMLLNQPTAEGSKDKILKYPYDEQALIDDYGHWELLNQFSEMTKIFTRFIETGEISDECEFYFEDDSVILNFFFCPGGYCYYMNFKWEKENDMFVITELSISLPSYM